MLESNSVGVNNENLIQKLGESFNLNEVFKSDFIF
jgi:hypothetical protein